MRGLPASFGIAKISNPKTILLAVPGAFAPDIPSIDTEDLPDQVELSNA
jgi:hypothetical protein